jgi:hypothetical protein
VREWIVSKPIDADELREVLGTAVSSGRSRILVVGRPEIRDRLATSKRRRPGVRGAPLRGGPRGRRIAQSASVLQALDLRGRRVQRAVVLFSDGPAAAPDAIRRLGLEVLPLEQAGQALVSALQEQPPADTGQLDD